jgi:hypothetical protein
MKRLTDPRAILGIDPTKRGLAFVFFEGGQLIDWGIRHAGSEIANFEAILNLCPADVIVLEDPDAERSERRPRMRNVLSRLARAAERRGLVVVKVSRFDVRRGWREREVTRKHSVAKAIAQEFPALEVFVPRPRIKAYMDEEARVQVFDAASLVLHAFGTAEATHSRREPSTALRDFCPLVRAAPAP